MSLFEVENAAMVDMQNWLVNGTRRAHEPADLHDPRLLRRSTTSSTTTSTASAMAASACPKPKCPRRTTRSINFSKPSEESLNPLVAPRTSWKSAFTTLQRPAASAIETLRDAGLCLLSGYFTDFSSSKLKSLYPTSASYASKFTTAANAEVAAGFMTPEDAAAAIANAKPASARCSNRRSTIP